MYCQLLVASPLTKGRTQLQVTTSHCAAAVALSCRTVKAANRKSPSSLLEYSTSIVLRWAWTASSHFVRRALPSGTPRERTPLPPPYTPSRQRVHPVYVFFNACCVISVVQLPCNSAVYNTQASPRLETTGCCYSTTYCMPYILTIRYNIEVVSLCM